MYSLTLGRRFRALVLSYIATILAALASRLRLAPRVPRHRLYRCARPNLLEAFHDHHIARVQPLVNEGTAVDLRPDGHSHSVYHAFTHHHEGVQAVRRALNSLHGHQQGFFIRALL